MNKYIKIFFRAINAGKTPHKNEDQSVAGMFCLNVSKLTQESDGDGSPTHVTQVCMSVWSNLKFPVIFIKLYHSKNEFLIQWCL